MQDKLDFRHFAEDFIRSKFLEKARLQGIQGLIEVRPADEVIKHKDHDFVTCTPDGWIRTIEEEWSGNTIPDKYYSQCQWVLEITGKPYMYILGWINNRFTKVFTVKRDQEFIDLCLNLLLASGKTLKII